MKRSVIARGTFSAVETCDCGALYLTVGPICMKLDPIAIPELLDVMSRAARQLGPDFKKTVAACSGEATPSDGGGVGESFDDQSN